MGITLEEPYYYERQGTEIDGIFQWIGNYRQDADIQFSYGLTQKLSSSDAKETPEKNPSQ